MTEILIRRTHGLAMDAAMKSVERVAEQLRAELKARGHWEGCVLKFECPGAEGSIVLEPAVISIAVRLSWLLSPARGRVERAISEYLDRALQEAAG